MIYYLVLLLFTINGNCKKAYDAKELMWKESTESPEILIDRYETNLNISLIEEKNDKEIYDSLKVLFLVTQINITTHYRLELIKHMDYNCLRTNCLNIHKSTTERVKANYYEKEQKCLKEAVTAGDDKNNAVTKITNEIKKWRKSYRYLKKECIKNNPDDPSGAKSCLVVLMERDNYGDVFNRLMKLRFDAHWDLYMVLRKSMLDLEVCLKTALSEYMSDVNSLRLVLSRWQDRIKNID